tara:strand:+ start:15 stop:896 length:882 start_codon:yes stop_codon:yes gene_type:complete
MNKGVFKSLTKSLLYIFLRNDYSWSILTDEERQLIKTENSKYNVLRDDYFDIKKFGISRQKDGERWDTFDLEVLLKNKVKGEDAVYLLNSLNKFQPRDVLEIGSGPGLFSKMIYDFSSVQSLTINDINPYFIEYISACEKRSSSSKNLKAIIGNLIDQNIKDDFDMIVIISSLHHIPERDLLFKKMERHLRKDGVIVVCEPSYYLKRIYHLLKKVPMFLDRNYRFNQSNYSTHSMCSLGEYRSIMRKCSFLEIMDINFNEIGRNRPFFKSLKSFFLRMLLSHRIFVTFQKKST